MSVDKANSRNKLADKFDLETGNPDSNTSRSFGKVLDNVYKPGFIDHQSPETTKMSVDRELSEISKALFKVGENQGKQIVETSRGFSSFEDKLTIISNEQESLAQKVTHLESVVGDGNASLETTLKTWVTDNFASTAQLSAAKSELNGNISTANTAMKTYVDSTFAKSTDLITLSSSFDSKIATAKTEVITYADNKFATSSALTALSVEIKGDGTSSNPGAIANAVSGLKTYVDSNFATTTALTNLESKLMNPTNGTVTTAIATAVNGLRTEVSTTYATSASQTALKAELNGNIATGDANMKTYVDGNFATSTQLNTVQAQIGTSVATAKTEIQTWVNQQGFASASSVSTIQAGLNSVTTTANANTTAINGVKANWGVTVQTSAGGVKYVSGIQLLDGTGGTEFNIRADKFSFTDTSGNKSGGFTSSGGVTSFKGDVIANNFYGAVYNTVFIDTQNMTGPYNEGVFVKAGQTYVSKTSFLGLPDTTTIRVTGTVPICARGNGYFYCLARNQNDPAPTYSFGRAGVKVVSGTGSTVEVPFELVMTLATLRAKSEMFFLYVCLSKNSDMGFGGGNFSVEQVSTRYGNISLDVR